MQVTNQQINAARKKCKQFEELTQHTALPVVRDGIIVFQITLADWAAREGRRVVIWEDMPRYSPEEIKYAKYLDTRPEPKTAASPLERTILSGWEREETTRVTPSTQSELNLENAA